ncbi:MAG: YopX family protein [Candidatus Gastranaerophilaceae bacterium]
MEDRFKFRFWDTRDKVMRDLTCHFSHKLDDYAEENRLMQCTGLKDKNGTLIYEGDIVRYKNDIEQTYEVIYCDMCVGFELYCHNKYWTEGDCYNSNGEYVDFGCMNCENCDSLKRKDYTDIEIIGNIYQTPELLNERK